MRVPCPGWLEMLIVPPDASTRSLRPMSPEPRDGSAPPVPSSWIDTCRTPSRTSTPTRTTEEPALGAVDPDVPVFESGDVGAADRAVVRSPGTSPVIGVHEAEEGPGQQFLAGVPEGPFEGGVHALEAAVLADDAEQVDGEVEDTLQLPLGSEVPAVDLGEGVDGVVHPGHQLSPGPLEGAGVRAVV